MIHHNFFTFAPKLIKSSILCLNRSLVGLTSANSINSDPGGSSSNSGKLERQRKAGELSRLKETRGTQQPKHSVVMD